MILETSFLVDFLRNKMGAVAKMKSLIDNNEAIGITTPTVFEIWTGLFVLDEYERKKDVVEHIIDNFLLFPLDNESAKISGKINGKLIRKGLRIDPEDCMIAGIAISNNQKLLAKDEHFKRIEGLKIEEY